ncbi:MAG: hypothetical protein OEV49_04825 [candidate division Zixibacteria bacterium]|nr:hypothetical protein [candidate division Zixibacteria bacterium]MDH3939071.1 hypothetical protein [candidate division Zixibacteria bacterium]MDH4033604.1 hypothetical protein [candidate division Zixibacteria bacterium]
MYGRTRFKAIVLSLAAVSATLLSVCSEPGEDMTSAIAPPNEIMGWRAADSVETYDRESIFDYINGAGEVYRSYAFQEVTVHRYTKPDAPEITVEIFDMGSSDDAFGVFSYTRESEEPGIGSAFERRGSVLCFWQDRYYVCVVAYKSSDDVKTAIDSLARAMAERLPPAGTIPALISLLPANNLIRFTERFFHIHPSLNYHYFLAEQNILNLTEHTNAVLASYEPGTTHLLCIEYPTTSDAKAARQSFIDNYVPETANGDAVMIETDKWVASTQADNYLTICFDAVDSETALELIGNMKANLKKAGMLGEDDHE